MNSISAGAFCYWNTHKADQAIIHTKNDKIVIDRLTDLFYVPFDIENTLTIHQKGWAIKKKLGLRNIAKIDAHYERALLRDDQDDEFKYPVYATSKYHIRYTNDAGIRKYGLDLFYSPKIIIGRTRDNTPFFDRKGEYANTNFPYLLSGDIDELEIRHKQLQSNFTKFWMTTGTQDVGGKRNAFIYHPTLRLFPNIPLTITDDDAIYEWLGLSDDEIRIVEYYAADVDGMNQRRDDRNT